MEDRTTTIKNELISQRDQIINEINNLENQLKNKRDYLLKVVGGLEIIDLLNDESVEEEQVEEE